MAMKLGILEVSPRISHKDLDFVHGPGSLVGRCSCHTAYGNRLQAFVELHAMEGANTFLGGTRHMISRGVVNNELSQYHVLIDSRVSYPSPTAQTGWANDMPARSQTQHRETTSQA